ncbi:MAG: phospho-N-acetylmuramoyl-pentapeptide-transferase [Clostridiales bacterium]|nr:phospho-N-acetylmuramoyl-pentapeptide-transferase [Clostridiales bacterium]
MFLTVLIFILSVVSVLVIARYFLPLLQKLKLGQPIHELALESHQAKQGTPTMGGLMFAAVTSVFTLVFSAVAGFSVSTLILILFSLLSMMIGFADDYTKIRQQHNRGLVWWQKVIAQLLIGFLFSVYCYYTPAVGSSVIVPFTNLEWNLGIWYPPLMTLVIIFIVNSANLLDGMDGLLASTSSIASIAWAAIAMFMLLTSAVSALNDLYGILFFSLALAGSLFAFLRYNYHPARLFMGDTGSMFLGAAMLGVSMLLRQPLLLLLIAFTMIVSSVSVIIQRIYYKLTHGKRIFLSSPIHYHFEKAGMNEPQIVAMYSAVESILAVLAVLSLPWI